jgi:hypothetical protein
MEPEQQERFAEAVERKKADADARSKQAPVAGGGDSAVQEEIQRSEVETGRPQDVYSARDKNSGKGKKTADKGNQ